MPSKKGRDAVGSLSIRGGADRDKVLFYFRQGVQKVALSLPCIKIVYKSGQLPGAGTCPPRTRLALLARQLCMSIEETRTMLSKRT